MILGIIEVWKINMIEIKCSKLQFNRILEAMQDYYDTDKCILGKTCKSCPACNDKDNDCKICLSKHVKHNDIKEKG